MSVSILVVLDWVFKPLTPRALFKALDVSILVVLDWVFKRILHKIALESITKPFSPDLVFAIFTPENARKSPEISLLCINFFR